MATNDYYRVRATREEREEKDYSGYFSKSNKRKAKKALKKSAIAIVIVVAVILGAVAGFFACKTTSAFSMNDYYVNGVKAAEADYVVVDVSSIRDELELAAENPLTMEDLYAGINLEDKGVTAKFLGMDLSKTIKIEYYYREDISVEATKVEGIDVKTAGVYYAVYTSDHFALKNTTLIRTIVITGVEIDG